MTERSPMRRMISDAALSEYAVVLALRLHNDRLGRHAAVDQIGTPDAAFGERRISAGAARGENVRREMPLVEIDRMVEPPLEDRRGMAAIFGRSHDHNHVRRTGFVARALPGNPHRERDQKPKDKRRQHHQQNNCRAPEMRYSYLNIVGDGTDTVGYQRG